MKIQRIRIIYGPNVFSDNPVLVMRLDLQDLTGKERYEIPGFIERLLAALPGMYEHHCAKGYRDRSSNAFAKAPGSVILSSTSALN